MAVISSVVPTSRAGFALRLTHTATYTGNSFGPGIGGQLAYSYGLRLPFLYAAGALLVVGLLTSFFVREDFDPAEMRRTVARLARLWRMLRLKGSITMSGSPNEAIGRRGFPTSIRVDNGTEFTWKAMDQRAYWKGATLDFSRPGKPTDNGLIEAFNGRLRAECLNEHWFLNLADAQEKLDAWRDDYNGEPPHGALKNMTPADFARQAAKRVEDNLTEDGKKPDGAPSRGPYLRLTG